MQDVHTALAQPGSSPEEFGHRLADERLSMLGLDELAISDVQDAVTEDRAAPLPFVSISTQRLVPGRKR